MINSQHEEIFLEPQRSIVPKLLAALAAFAITAVVVVGYTVLRKRHAQNAPPLASATQPHAEPRQPPQALVMVDDALLQGNKTRIAGTVKNTSANRLEGLSVELELKRRKDAVIEKQLVPLQPSQLDPQQEGRYSLELKAQDYGSARLVGLKSGANLAAVPITTTQGQKRPPERLETKTVTIGKRPPGKEGEFLNTPDNPVRVP
jgi:hypothetical protein